jgi:hypothetical protein
MVVDTIFWIINTPIIEHATIHPVVVPYVKDIICNILYVTKKANKIPITAIIR